MFGVFFLHASATCFVSISEALLRCCWLSGVGLVLFGVHQPWAFKPFFLSTVMFFLGVQQVFGISLHAFAMCIWLGFG